MASVIPSIFVAFVTISIMISILGGITQHYSEIFTEPVILPAYGLIYVDSVDRENYVVSIVNRYGYTIRAVFTVYVSDIPSLPENMTIATLPYVSFWVDLYPGTNTIYLLDYVRMVLGLGVSHEAVIDLEKSYFIIGEVEFPLEPGAGRIKPPTSSMMPRTYVVRGLGVNPLSTNYQGFSSIAFDSTRAVIQHNVRAKMGYRRTIYGYNTYSLIVKLEKGQKCKCPTYWYSGYEKREENGEEYCAYTLCSHYSCYKESIWFGQVKRFGCAYHSYTYKPIYWTKEIRKSNEFSFDTVSLLSINHFTNDVISKDTILKYFSGTTYVSKNWPYILEDQSECHYTYEEYTWHASLWWSTFLACDEECGVTRSYRDCSDWYVLETEERDACSYPRPPYCAKETKYLYAKIRSVVVNITTPLTTRQKLEFRITLKYFFRYFMGKNDPNAGENDIRLYMNSVVKLSLPKMLGYIAIPYTDELGNVKATLGAEITQFQAKLKSVVGGTTLSGSLLSYTVESDSYDVTITPVGYGDAKTFKYETISNPAIIIKLSTPGDGIAIQRFSRDTLILTVDLVLEVTPELEVQVLGVEV